MKTLPQFLKPYFWDVDFAKLDYRKYPQFVVERILEYGNKRAIAWMRRCFSKRQIVLTLTRTRNLTEKSANFWALLFSIKKGKVRCLKRSFRMIQKRFWPY